MTTGPFLQRGLWRSVHALLLLAASSCGGSSTPATQVVVVVNSDLAVESTLSRVEVSVLSQDGEAASGQPFPFVLTDDEEPDEGTYRLPLSFGIAKKSGGADSFRVEVRGYGPLGKGGGEVQIAEQIALATFEAERTLQLNVFLGTVCLQAQCEDEDEVCYPDALGRVAAGDCGPVREAVLQQVTAGDELDAVTGGMASGGRPDTGGMTTGGMTTGGMTSGGQPDTGGMTTGGVTTGGVTTGGMTTGSVMATGGCMPQCTGRECGPDGCGGTCGGCQAGFDCEDGQCSCTNACAGRSCGTDACGNNCGTCAAGETCTAAGQCNCPGGATTYYRDNDLDSYGSATNTRTVCSGTPPAGYVRNSTDCCDNDSDAYPGSPLGQTRPMMCTGTTSLNNYDFDCSGQNQGAYVSLASGTCCTSWVDGWIGSVPLCGQGGTFQFCDTSTCLPTNYSAVQECK